jgi:hypothetical protein
VPPNEAIEALRANRRQGAHHVTIPSDTVRYLMNVRQGKFIRSDLQPDGTWLKSSSIRTQASPVAESGTTGF